MSNRLVPPMLVAGLVCLAAFQGARWLVHRWPAARALFVGLGLVAIAGGFALFFALPRLIPDRPAPALTVVYYGGWLVCAALVVIGACAAAGAATAERA